MSKFEKYTIHATAIFGFLTIVFGIILLYTFPHKADLSEGYRTPIIAFEFAKTEADLAFLSGNSELSRTNRDKMDAGHAWDMAFPFAYAGFIVLLLLQLTKANNRFMYLGLIFAVLIIPFDINENLTLLKITSALDNAISIDALLLKLHIATWLKWGAIGMSIAVLTVSFAVSMRFWSALLSLLVVIGIVACWVSNAKPAIAETMSMLIFLFFLIFSIKAFVESWNLIRQTRINKD